MDPATLLTLAQTIIQVLDSSFVKEFGSVGRFRSEVEKLKCTMSTIKAVLIDAEDQERQLVLRRNVEHDWLVKLRDVVYEADDLFDRIASIAQRKRLMSTGNTLKEVLLFFSRSNQLAFARNAFREVKMIRERLDDISKDHRDYYSRPPCVSSGGRIVAKRREDSHSFVYAEDVIGRDADKKAIIDMLLDSSVRDDVHFVTIVGIGGLGKTTLAQYMYNDDRIVTEFPLRMWVCVSDEFNIRDILCKLLNSTINQHFEVEEVQRRVRQKINRERYLLVLDDVWNEDRHEWLKLENLLIGGVRGSRVVVTSRSKMVATIVGDGLTYELKGLSPKDSWSLFEKMAFRNEIERMDDDLIEIGQHVLKKCANVPLAIRVVGSLLYGQTKSIWESFKNRDLIKMKRDDKDGILPILKLSYHHLTLELKNCFSYCAVFPKDYWIEKEILVNLWMAHGFLSPSEGQRVKDAAEEYFMILLQRCFFQDAVRDDYGEIVTCKLHDLMHDVAQEAVGRDILVVDNVSELKEKIRHLSFSRLDLRNSSSSFSEIENIRTLFRLQRTYSVTRTREIREFLKKATYLRVLCLTSGIQTLPRAIDKLIHLRYLDLSHNYELEFLPATLCKLNNLQTLILKECLNLKELPTKLSKLEKLRYLDIEGCRLDHMPPRLSNLTCLEKLPQFVASHSRVGQAIRGELQDLEPLKNVGGSLKIRVRGFSTYQVTEGAKYVSGMIHLKDMHIEISCLLNDDAGSTLLLECLQPNRYLTHFNLSGYGGVAFPKWESIEDLKPSLPLLVELSLSDCTNLQHLPLLSQLHHLKTLNLINLDNLEDIEGCGGSLSVPVQDQSAFFPRLEKLHLVGLPKLKRWPKSSSESGVTSLNYNRSPVAYTFPRLFDLNISNCPYMTSIPLASSVRSLILSLDAPYSESFMMSSCCLTGSGELTIKFCYYEGLNSLSIVKELFRSHLSTSLCSLHIKKWPYLKSLCGGGLEHLTALEKLHLSGLPDLEELEDSNNSHLPWKFLTRLRVLELQYLPKLVNLPQGIQHLAALQSLRVEACHMFELSAESESESGMMSLNYRCSPVSCTSHLFNLSISKCPYMTSIPLASNVRSLILSLDKNAPHSSSFLSSCHLASSDELTIKFCCYEGLNSLSIVEELFRSHLSTSLYSLHIKKWPYLKSLCGGGLEHLTALQTLHLSGLPDLEELEDGSHSHLPWKFLTRLRDLELQYLPKLVNLPQGIQHLTSLQSLRVEACDMFELSAKCASRLTSVKYLFIYRCYGLKSLPKAALSGLPSLEQVEIKSCGLPNNWIYELSPPPPRRF